MRASDPGQRMVPGGIMVEPDSCSGGSGEPLKIHYCYVLRENGKKGRLRPAMHADSRGAKRFVTEIIGDTFIMLDKNSSIKLLDTMGGHLMAPFPRRFKAIQFAYRYHRSNDNLFSIIITVVIVNGFAFATLREIA